jgi:choline dehydrogenase-like flavoprotein
MRHHYDLIIIGSGAGGTLARYLAPSGKGILILERGDWLKREALNSDATAVFVENRYISKGTWYDGNVKAFQPQVQTRRSPILMQQPNSDDKRRHEKDQ